MYFEANCGKLHHHVTLSEALVLKLNKKLYIARAHGVWSV